MALHPRGTGAAAQPTTWEVLHFPDCCARGPRLFLSLTLVWTNVFVLQWFDCSAPATWLASDTPRPAPPPPTVLFVFILPETSSSAGLSSAGRPPLSPSLSLSLSLSLSRGGPLAASGHSLFSPRSLTGETATFFLSVRSCPERRICQSRTPFFSTRSCMDVKASSGLSVPS